MHSIKIKRILPLFLIICMFSISGNSCKRSTSKERNARQAGQYGYRGIYLDLPEKEGYKLYDIGDIFMDQEDSYCLSVIYSHYNENDNTREFVTDILTVDRNGNITYTLEIMALQVVRAVFEKEYVYFAYSDKDLIDLQNSEKTQSELTADLLFFDKKTGNVTRIIHPEINAGAVYKLSDGFAIIGDNSIAKYSYDGTLLSTIHTEFDMTPTESSVFESLGKTYLLTSDNEWISDYYELDFTAKKVEYIIGTDNLNADVETCSREYFFSQKGEYKVDLSNMQIQPLALWNDIDIRPNKMSDAENRFVALDDTHFARKTVYRDGTGDVGFFTYDNSINSDRTRITIGGYGVYTDEILQWAVYEFNTNNEQYRAIVEDYTEEFSYDTPQEAQTAKLKLMKYFNEGHTPDIFYGDSFDYGYLGNAGMVMDLMQFFDKDNERSLSEFPLSIQNVLMPDEAHCYSVFSSFSTSGYWGLKKDFSSNQVSLSEIRELTKNTEKQFTCEQSAPSIAGEALTYNFAGLWGAYGKDKAVTREEIQEFVKLTIDLGIDPSISWGGVCDFKDVYNGLYYLSSAGPSDLFSLAQAEKDAHDRLVFVGYPSIRGSVHLVIPYGMVGISSSTKYPEQCWEFLRGLLSNNIQKKIALSGRIPVNEEVIELMCHTALDPENAKDEDMKRYVIGKTAVSQEAVDDFLELVNSIDTIRTIDWGAYNIICEEISSYYTQDRSIEQITDTLDKRLSLYVQENYQ